MEVEVSVEGGCAGPRPGAPAYTSGST